MQNTWRHLNFRSQLTEGIRWGKPEIFPSRNWSTPGIAGVKRIPAVDACMVSPSLIWNTEAASSGHRRRALLCRVLSRHLSRCPYSVSTVVLMPWNTSRYTSFRVRKYDDQLWLEVLENLWLPMPRPRTPQEARNASSDPFHRRSTIRHPQHLNLPYPH